MVQRIASSHVHEKQRCPRYPISATPQPPSRRFHFLIQPWNLASGLAVSLLAACTGMFWGVSVVYVKNLRGYDWGISDACGGDRLELDRDRFGNPGLVATGKRPCFDCLAPRG